MDSPEHEELRRSLGGADEIMPTIIAKSMGILPVRSEKERPRAAE